MSGASSVKPRESRVQDSAAYTCTDGTDIYYNCDALRIEVITGKIICWAHVLVAPANGILLEPGKQPTVFVSGVQMSRDAQKIIRGGFSKTYVFPDTITAVGEDAFQGRRVISARLNEGLETLEEYCFSFSKIRKLVLPSSVVSVGDSAFTWCERLGYADLSAAHGLK